MKQAHYVELLFENCESIIIPVERVQLKDCGVFTPMRRDGVARDAYTVNHLTLTISYTNEEELVYQQDEHKEPLGMFVANPTSNHVTDRPHILGRILCHDDIIGLEYLDEEQKPLQAIYVPWGEEPFVNTCMETNVTPREIVLTFQEHSKQIKPTT